MQETRSIVDRVWILVFLCLPNAAIAAIAAPPPLLSERVHCSTQRSNALTPRTLRELIIKLSTKKAPVRRAGRVSQPFFSSRGRILKVGSEEIQAFEYKTIKSAASDAAKIGPDGTPGETMVNWIAPPHFYKSGKLIVLYIGNDRRLIERLESVLGLQYAGK